MSCTERTTKRHTTHRVSRAPRPSKSPAGSEASWFLYRALTCMGQSRHETGSDDGVRADQIVSSLTRYQPISWCDKGKHVSHQRSPNTRSTSAKALHVGIARVSVARMRGIRTSNYYPTATVLSVNTIWCSRRWKAIISNEHVA